MVRPEHVGTLVIGAGPAGLAAGAALAALGRPFLVVDRGRDVEARRHDAAADLGEGVGGAGLFSDGKFSFYPSGTNLYTLADPPRLRRAYAWSCKQLNNAGIGTIPFPEIAEGFRYTGEAIKEYPSFYGTLPARRALIADLRDLLRGQLVTGTAVIRVEPGPAAGSFVAVLASDGHVRSVIADRVIFAMGRLGPLQPGVRGAGLLRLRPLRYEIGIRIEAPHESTFLARLKAADVKRLAQVRGFELRTFCTCRRGEIWNIPYGDYSAISGRSDGPPTAYSNFGFLVRLDGDNLPCGEAVWSHIEDVMRRRRTAVYQPLAEFLGETPVPEVAPEGRPWLPRNAFERGDVHGSLGPVLAPVVAEGVRGLLEWAPELRDPRTVCLFPALEGVGEFPAADDELRIADGLWCAGDMVGRLRGIVPSLVSGYYAGLAAGA